MATPSLETTLDKRAYKLPTANVARKKVQAIYTQLCGHGLCPDRLHIVIDCNANKARWVVDHTPCLTATRGAYGGFFVAQLGRMLNMAELFRLQGFDPADMTTT